MRPEERAQRIQGYRHQLCNLCEPSSVIIQPSSVHNCAFTGQTSERLCYTRSIYCSSYSPFEPLADSPEQERHRGEAHLLQGVHASVRQESFDGGVAQQIILGKPRDHLHQPLFRDHLATNPQRLPSLATMSDSLRKIHKKMRAPQHGTHTSRPSKGFVKKFDSFSTLRMQAKQTWTLLDL